MKKYLVPSLLFCAGIIFFGFYSLLGFDLHHDGIMFQAAVDVANGKVPFRETFSQYGILTPLLQGLFVRIFGAELIVLKLLTAVFYGASLTVYDAVCKRIFAESSRYCRITAILMFFFLSPDCCVTAHPWASVYALFFLLLLIYFSLRFLDEEKNSIRYSLYSGLCAGIMFGLRQPCGLTAFLSAILFAAVLFSYNRKKCLQYSYGFFSGAAVLLAVFAALITYWNAWSDYWLQTWSHALSFAVKRGGGSGTYGDFVINFFPFITGDRGFLDIIFAVFPLLTLGVLGFFFLGGKWKNNLPLVCIILFALGAWHQYYPVPCMRHLYWAAVPMMIVSVYAAEQLLIHGGIRGRITVGILILLLLMPMVFRGYFAARRIHTLSKRERVQVRGVRGLFLFGHEKQITMIFNSINSALPPEIKSRGVFNHTPDGIWSVVLSPCRDFKHPMFCRLGEHIYRNYDRDAYRYCLEKRPVVISSLWQSLPGYIPAQPISYNGVTYFVLFPEK